MALIVVESPTKARTFNRILKIQNKADKYFVYATMGHFRDLPASKMAIDFTKQFKPEYVIDAKKKKVADQLKELAEKNDEIILATDLDREGESISYHVAYLLGFIKEKWPQLELKKEIGKRKVSRIVFHEITPKALQEALDNPQELRLDLVKAQQGRRLLDRIVGYELSPLLWKKMGKNWLSAGRVQTVALRLIVEREKEIQKFSQEEYYQIYGEFGVEPEGGEVRLVKRDVAEARQYQKPGTNEDKKPSNIIKAKLIKKDDVDYEIKTKIELFDGEYTFTKTTINKDNVDNLQKDLQMDSYTVSEVKEDITKRYPPPPFTTSLLQQEAFQKYGFSSKMTMRLAQNLYERGLITYHRTDSFSLSTQFVFRAKDYIEATYGKEYALEKPRGYKNKSKSAQEAHEAIRPTHLDKPIDELFKEKKEKADGESSSFTQHHRKLYELIFNRAVATQMKEADIKVIKMYMKGAKGYLFEAEHQEVIFDGFLRVLNPDFARAKLNVQLKQGQSIPLSLLQADASLTKAPPRYNEASLIKTLEEKGIGRPSTYAPIISLIQDKYYVEKESRYFTPTKLGTAISDYLSEAFPQVFNLNFTAQMEEGLDEVANGNQELVKLLTDFYEPFEKVVDERKGDTKVIDVEEDINETCPNCGSKLTVRFSKFGKFMACSNYPNCKFTKPFLTYVNNKFCPDCKGRLTVRYTKSRKRFYGCENYPKCKFSTWALKDIK